ncbi:hypothetical protein PHYBLDRAFT_171254 [Phycomyces blakesleeanus NRRL 1555(-)]|uniref:Uncharacterized protein n=1 Tax=Phycomyces blakesleeanus (strain ATCC 8743b / DSM 1359 / FGSC 10004 / NBRC 33097 / NRRL 1555) TaxID=763407 RepID=A0A162TRK3_PHYB8|nr:hypothetical protein PHYBLDRAFT_171254 [Phycomyces blakesleeanus NRRL 1555(-)]OAD70502.1 hypothetical protein PHYBLDRAFT_171254 [Phycomyces blakesleeanus NRRL 1555(-)]|eukprot:XP_018288542.1 hypothetical protein PHYBLDRAFT_171254 [Phycomyces blakesleeanus NRRL 1555(-)]
MSDAPLFTSDLAMWSPPVISAFLSPISSVGYELADDPITFIHEPVYLPLACVICGLPHALPPQPTTSLPWNPVDIMATPVSLSEKTHITSDRSHLYSLPVHTKHQSLFRAFVQRLARIVRRLIQQKRHIYPVKRSHEYCTTENQEIRVQ